VALESYSLDELTRRIRNEFGIADSDTTQSALIADKINEAVALIVRRRPNWPWQRKTLSLDIPNQVAGTATVVQGSRTITSIVMASGALAARDTLLFGTGIDPASVYMVTAVNGNTATLEHQYVGASGTAVALKKRTGYVQLPEDFLRLDTAAPVEDLTFLNRFEFATLTQWEHLRRDVYQPSTDVWYTVGPDPLTTDGRYYMYLYPPMPELRVVRGSYFIDPPRMQFGTDEPMLPRNDRPAILYYAMNLYAIMRSDERANLYWTIAEKEMTNMLLHHGLSEDEPFKTPSFYQVPYTDVTTDPGAPDYVGGG